MGMFRNKFILILIQGKVVKEPLNMTPPKLLKNEFFSVNQYYHFYDYISKHIQPDIMAISPF